MENKNNWASLPLSTKIKYISMALILHFTTENDFNDLKDFTSIRKFEFKKTGSI